MRVLLAKRHTNIITRTHHELDLTNQQAVTDFFKTEKPDYVFLAAAKVGGILANSQYPADFISQNLSIQTNVIQSAHATKVKRLLFLGSSCIYPRDCPQPIKEEYLLTGPLEKSNEAYAIAKIAGIKMCQSYNQQYGTQFLSVMPTNLFGPNDNYDLNNSHVLPALIRKFHEAKVNKSPDVTLWGTGTPKREFLYSDELAEACCFLMNQNEESFKAFLKLGWINIGTGVDIAIKELAELIKTIVGYTGTIVWDHTKPDGTPRKLLDVSRLNNLGWKSKMGFREALEKTYGKYLP